MEDSYHNMNQPLPKTFSEVITPDMKLCSLLETYWHIGRTSSEDGGSWFLWISDKFLQDHTVSHPTRQIPASCLLWRSPISLQRILSNITSLTDPLITFLHQAVHKCAISWYISYVTDIHPVNNISYKIQ